VIANQDGVEVSEGITDALDLKRENRDFNAYIGSKITFNGNYGLKEKTDRKGYRYYIHNAGVSYIQGFQNRFNASTIPMYSIYYQLNIWNRITAGVNYNSFGNVSDMGMNVGFRLAGFNVGVGSNSLFAAINRDASKQVNLFFLLGIAI
jgi:hypothetical protein